MENKTFTEPEVIVLRVEQNDVICTSGETCSGAGLSELFYDIIG